MFLIINVKKLNYKQKNYNVWGWRNFFCVIEVFTMLPNRATYSAAVHFHLWIRIFFTSWHDVEVHNKTQAQCGNCVTLPSSFSKKNSVKSTFLLKNSKCKLISRIIYLRIRVDFSTISISQTYLPTIFLHLSQCSCKGEKSYTLPCTTLIFPLSSSSPCLGPSLSDGILLSPMTKRACPS